MANDKKNINELVSDDDDPTAELEALSLAVPESDEPKGELELAATTTGLRHAPITDAEHAPDLAKFRADLEVRDQTIGRLEFEVARLQARQLGLEAETRSREEVNTQLRSELDNAASSLLRKQGLLKKRDQQIKALRLEIRERNERFHALQQQLQTTGDGLTDRRGSLKTEASATATPRSGQMASDELAIVELRRGYMRLESYADELRQRLQDSDIETRNNRGLQDVLRHDLSQAVDRIKAQEVTIANLNEQNAKLGETLTSLKSSHAEEVRIIRFELGSAQETLSQHELLTEQLASDLVETRGYRVQLENMLSASEESSKSRIEKLEQENQRLRREISESLLKLETKSEAINCLISELAKKSHQADAIKAMDRNIDVRDGPDYGHVENQSPVDRDRVTRVLVGSIDNQEVRFPLFKDRLTIGRTEQNDIQLKAAHISRRHAVIVSEGGTTRVTDWGSKNGVFVNARRVTEHFLKHGDVVSIGTSEFRYEERAKREPRDN
ncbi:MAG: FHA domain-containing protein [Gammaproteobacteria bacterium]|nr:FHA domain-containing protein [Gammaproteobacteria bacterium]